jgi:hypothetical protein
MGAEHTECEYVEYYVSPWSGRTISRSNDAPCPQPATYHLIDHDEEEGMGWELCPMHACIMDAEQQQPNKDVWPKGYHIEPEPNRSVTR